jgi:hypothetical protein
VEADPVTITFVEGLGPFTPRLCGVIGQEMTIDGFAVWCDRQRADAAHARALAEIRRLADTYLPGQLLPRPPAEGDEWYSRDGQMVFEGGTWIWAYASKRLRTPTCDCGHAWDLHGEYGCKVGGHTAAGWYRPCMCSRTGP